MIARNSSFAYKGSRPDIRTAARALGVRYLLQGSLRRAAERVRVTAQLVDGAPGTQVWASRDDHALADIFDVQDELTDTIIAAIEPEVARAERVRARSKRPDNVDAWDLYQRGMHHLYLATREDLQEAQTLFARQLDLDPNLVPAYAGSADWAHYGVGAALVFSGHAKEGVPHLERAIRLSPRDPYMGSFLVRKADAYLLTGDYEKSVEWAMSHYVDGLMKAGLRE